MFPKERKMNIKLDKSLVEKFLVVAISLLRSRYLGRHAAYFHDVINFLSRPQIIVSFQLVEAFTFG